MWQHAGFNLHAATKVAANDKQGRLALCKYTLRPPLANDRLKILDDNVVRLDGHVMEPWKGSQTSRMVRGEPKLAGSPRAAWSDGTSSVELAPLAIIARLAALVPPPRGISRAILAYSRRTAASAASAYLPPCPSRRPSKKTSPRGPCRSHTIFHGASCSEERSRSTSRVLRCQSPLRLIALIKNGTPSKRSCLPWACRPRHPNPIRQRLLRPEPATAQST